MQRSSMTCRPWRRMAEPKTVHEQGPPPLPLEGWWDHAFWCALSSCYFSCSCSFSTLHLVVPSLSLSCWTFPFSPLTSLACCAFSNFSPYHLASCREFLLPERVLTVLLSAITIYRSSFSETVNACPTHWLFAVYFLWNKELANDIVNGITKWCFLHF